MAANLTAGTRHRQSSHCGGQWGSETKLVLETKGEIAELPTPSTA
jgi:hypothetical protein